MDVGEFERAGLYDPTMAGAEDRRALLDLLTAEGATIEEMQSALADDRLVGLAVDTVVRPPGERITFDEMCEQAGLDPLAVTSLLRAAGFARPDPGDRVFTDADVRCFRFLSMITLLDDAALGLQVTRAAGAAMSSLAEAELAAVRSSVEGPLRETGAGELEQAQSFRAVASVLPELLHVLDVFHRRHLLVGMRTRILWDGGRPNVDAAIGFADVVGYTTQVLHVDAAGLAAMVDRFETAARDVIADGGGRLVKLIGDEVMFQAATADRGCRIAADLLATFASDAALPDLRVGLAYGQVLAFEGDYYGRAVNVAARLVKDAAPRSALVTRDVRDGAGGEFAFESVGPRPLKGIGTIEAFRLG